MDIGPKYRALGRTMVFVFDLESATMLRENFLGFTFDPRTGIQVAGCRFAYRIRPLWIGGDLARQAKQFMLHEA